MIIRPAKLGGQALETEALVRDRKACRRFGPCGVGERALYLNSFYIDCRYYLPYPGITRAFKRVAMSKGGFTRKGVFASIPYLVVEYDGGKQKQCNFKYEDHVDQLLLCLARERPEIKQVSAQAEERLRLKELERAKRPRPVLSEEAERSREELARAAAYLEKRPELSLELSQAARRKRAFLLSKPSYRWAAMAITLLGLAALVYGVWSLVARQGNFGIYFTLFGLAAIFTFAGVSVLPTAQNNKKAILKRMERAEEAMERYLAGCGAFPLPARYAHPVVLRRMDRVIESGRASSPSEALDLVKQDLKALNASVEVDQEEYDEVVAVKAMFLGHDYQ